MPESDVPSRHSVLSVLSVLSVNEGLTRQVARLARLELSDPEVQVFTEQLSEVLKYVETLQEVEVAGVEPLTHPLDLPTALRDDVARDFGKNNEGQPKVLTSAPDALNGGFKVPQII